MGMLRLREIMEKWTKETIEDEKSGWREKLDHSDMDDYNRDPCNLTTSSDNKHAQRVTIIKAQSQLDEHSALLPTNNSRVTDKINTKMQQPVC